jgi:hypothetical protein
MRKIFTIIATRQQGGRGRGAGAESVVRLNAKLGERDDGESSARRSSSRARKVAPKMGAALLDSNTRAQVILLPFPVAETLNLKP